MPARLDRVLRLRVALVVAVFAACVVAVLLLRPLTGGDEKVPVIPTPPGATRGEAVSDPFAWTPKRSADLSKRAAAGTAHLLYTRSPGGAAATATRVARFRAPIESAAKAAGVDPNRLEALVFLESAGRADARAPGGIEGAAGLTQILAETATNLLAMRVDLVRSGSYTRRMDRALHAGNLRRAAALNRARRRVDDRFDPAKALAGTARYLKLAKQRFGREDLAFVSYHMGMGNLENVLKAFGDGRRSYAELYFDSTPLRHKAAYAKLASFGDDSSNYFWKLGAAMEIMRLARQDKGRLARIASLQTADDSARRLLLHGAPQGDLRTLSAAAADAALTTTKDLRLRPEALGVSLYAAAQVRTISGAPALDVTGAADGGWTFRVSRTYASDRQALAFQYVLDRLQVLNVIAWSRSARSIDVTASRDAKVLEPLLDRLGGKAK
jgi:hypothetical protein